MLRRAVEQDPLDAIHTANLASCYLTNGKFAEAREWSRRAKELSPGIKPSMLEGWASILTGDAAQALIEFQKVDGPGSLAGASAALHALGRERESRDALGRLEREHPDASIAIAGARAWRGDLDGGFAALDEAIQAKHQGLWSLRTSQLLRPLQSDPRFPALLRKLGFPEEGASGKTPAP